MKWTVLIALVLLSFGATAESNGKRRYLEIANRVRSIVVAPDFPSRNVNSVGVELPQRDWCSPSAVFVRTCGSARPKRELYWLELSCGERVTYVVEYDADAPHALTLIAPAKKSACRD